MMKICLPLVLAGLVLPAAAQTPAVSLMPDGSRDMYVGLGVQSRPLFDGSGVRKTEAVPAIQVQWSNGVFISGASAGWHLSGDPAVEYGPLLTIDAGRNADGTRTSPLGELGSASASGGASILPGGADLPAPRLAGTGRNRLAGMPDIDTTLTAGGFFNYVLGAEMRLMTSATYGAGNDHDGLLAQFNLQKSWSGFAPHHTLVLTGGFTWANRAYQRSYFGVTAGQHASTGHAVYTPGGGLKDVHLAGRWNWALSNAWLLNTSIAASVLRGPAAHSPLIERRANLSASTALAYRF
jgi:outer membrane protein